MASNTSLVSVDAADSARTLNEFFSHFGGDDDAFVNECKGLVDGLKTEALLLTKRQNSYISILAKWEYVYLPQRRNFFVMWLFFDFITVNL
jgi:hypothetical protein